MKNLEAIFLFADFSKVFDSILRGKIEQLLLVYVLPTETVTTIMMLNKNTKVKVHSPDGDTDFVAGVLREDTLAPYLFIICLDYVLWMVIDLMKENGFMIKKGKKQMIPCTNYYRHRLHRWHIALLANTSTEFESLQYSLEQAASGTGLHMNTGKTEYMSFNRKGDISTLNGGYLKLVDKFTYLRRSVSSSENYINLQLVQA